MFARALIGQFRLIICPSRYYSKNVITGPLPSPLPGHLRRLITSSQVVRVASDLGLISTPRVSDKPKHPDVIEPLFHVRCGCAECGINCKMWKYNRGDKDALQSSLLRAISVLRWFCVSPSVEKPTRSLRSFEALKAHQKFMSPFSLQVPKRRTLLIAKIDFLGILRTRHCRSFNQHK